jgi:hypothetical protein
MSLKNKEPRRLKRLDQTDLLTVEDKNGDYLVVTKQEVTKIIREFITSEIGNLPDEISERHKKDLSLRVNNKMLDLERDLLAFINYKFDSVAEKACEMLLNRKFNEEIDKRVEIKVEQLLLEKQKKGRF